MWIIFNMDASIKCRCASERILPTELGFPRILAQLKFIVLYVITDAFCVCIGNNWGIDPKTGSGCSGCGPQEEFYACADVKISRMGGTVAMPT